MEGVRGECAKWVEMGGRALNLWLELVGVVTELDTLPGNEAPCLTLQYTF